MGLFAISDLHLSLFCDKPMDQFGVEWKNHPQKLKKNWLAAVSPQDTVLLPGDLSWGMRLEEAEGDLGFIHDLPGRKILISGNHDYWWTSLSKLNGLYSSLLFMKNSHTWYGDYAICGSRGWLCPGDNGFTKEDQKIYKRELGRLSMSLEGAMGEGAKKIILMLHYPPASASVPPDALERYPGFFPLIRQYPVERILYGHIHGAHLPKGRVPSFFPDIPCHLVSADYLGFTPLRIDL